MGQFTLLLRRDRGSADVYKMFYLYFDDSLICDEKRNGEPVPILTWNGMSTSVFYGLIQLKMNSSRVLRCYGHVTDLYVCIIYILETVCIENLQIL